MAMKKKTNWPVIHAKAFTVNALFAKLPRELMNVITYTVMQHVTQTYRPTSLSLGAFQI